MNRRWLKTEWKRSLALLPGIIGRAALLIAACAAAAAVLYAVFSSDTQQELVRIGYTAQEDALTDMLVSYVQDMKSVKSYCSLVRVEREEGFALLEEGGLDVLLVLPDDILGEILSGSNAPVTVYFSDENAIGSGAYASAKRMIFEELADAAVGMLETAQAEIYAVQYLLGDDASDRELVNSLYDEINRFNLALISGRESVFMTRTLSATENDTYVIYYASAFLALYLLIAGAFLGGIFSHSEQWRNILEKRLGAARLWQTACAFLAGLLPAAFLEIMPFALLFSGAVRELLSVQLSRQTALLFILSAAFCVLYFMLIYRIFGGKSGALPAIGILAAVQGYMSGCFVPSALLPDLVYVIGKYLPAAYLKQAFTAVISGETRRFVAAAQGLLVWIVLLAAADMAAALCGQGRSRQADYAAPKRMRVPTIVGAVFRRVIFKRGIWAALLLMAAVSFLIARLENGSDTTFTAAVFDESGDYAETLLTHEGLVRFLECGSEDEVKELVLRGEAECGYVLPENLPENLTAMRANGSITVYQASDSVGTPLANEVVFSAVFGRTSLEWYTAYMEERCPDSEKIRVIFEEQLALGKTFGLETVTLGGGKETVSAPENEQSYPVETVAAAASVLCGAQGLMLAIDDYRKGRYYKKGRKAVFALTVVLPVLIAAAAGKIILLLISGLS